HDFCAPLGKGLAKNRMDEPQRSAAHRAVCGPMTDHISRRRSDMLLRQGILSAATFLATALPATCAPQEAGPRRAKEPSRPKAYEFMRAVDANTLVLLIDGRPTKVGLLGVDPVIGIDKHASDALAARFLSEYLRGQKVYLK